MNTHLERGNGLMTPLDDNAMQRASLLSIEDDMSVFSLLAGAWVKLPNVKMMGV